MRRPTENRRAPLIPPGHPVPDLGVAAILAAHEEHARAHRAHHDHHVKAALEAWRDAAAAELKRAGEAARDEAAAHV